MTAILVELLTKVGAATGPDRVLDRDIYAWLCEHAWGWLPAKVGADCDGKNAGEVLTQSGRLPDGYTFPPKGAIPRNWFVPSDAITDRVDDALTLVARALPGWIGMLSFGGAGACRCDLLSPVKEIGSGIDGEEVEVRDEAWGEATTPALAIVAAAIRALLVKEAP